MAHLMTGRSHLPQLGVDVAEITVWSANQYLNLRSDILRVTERNIRGMNDSTLEVSKTTRTEFLSHMRTHTLR